jgi:hypothetical protein
VSVLGKDYDAFVTEEVFFKDTANKNPRNLSWYTGDGMLLQTSNSFGIETKRETREQAMRIVPADGPDITTQGFITSDYPIASPDSIPLIHWTLSAPPG